MRPRSEGEPPRFENLKKFVGQSVEQFQGQEKFMVGDLVSWTEEAKKQGVDGSLGEGPFEAISSYGLPGAGRDPNESSLDIWIGLQKTDGDKKFIYTRTGQWRELEDARSEWKKKAGPSNVPKLFANKWFKKVLTPEKQTDKM